MCHLRLPKRTELAPNGCATPDSGSEVPSEPRLEPAPLTHRTITFDEVYGNGNAADKFWIVENKGEYYILRCNEHGNKFGDSETDALKAATAHLKFGDHDNRRWTYDKAIQHVGIRISNCDAQKKRLNNDAYTMTHGSGNRSHDEWTTARGELQSQEQGPPAGNTRPRGHRDSRAVVDPTPGGIYRASWGRSPDWRAVIFIPRNCFGDPSFADVGLEGCLAGAHPLDNVPACYSICPETGRITDWEAGYEDGGVRVGDRRYPIMSFDEAGRLQESSLVWVPATDLRPYDCETCASNGGLIANNSALQKVLTRRDNARAGAGTQEQEGMGDECSSEVMELEQSESDVSSRPEQHADINEALLEMTTPDHAATSPPAPDERSVEATDPQEISGANLPSHTPTTSSLPVPSFSGFAFEPIHPNIMGHVVTQADDVASQNSRHEGTGTLGNDRVGTAMTDSHETRSAASNHIGGHHDRPQNQSHAQVVHSIPSTSYAVPPSGRGWVSEEALSSFPPTVYPATAVSLDGRENKEAMELGRPLTFQRSGLGLVEPITSHNDYSAPEPEPYRAYSQSTHHSATYYEPSAQLSTNRQGTFRRHEFQGVPSSPPRSSSHDPRVAEFLPIPFEGSRKVPTQQDPSSETLVSSAAERSTRAPEATALPSHQGYIDLDA